MRTHSDQHPLLVHSDIAFVCKSASFKFFKTWTTHADCRPILLNIWKNEVVDSGMHRLQKKNVESKGCIPGWNKSVFGDVQSFGDRNTTYFYRMAHIKSSAKPITLLKNGNNCITDPNEMEAPIIVFLMIWLRRLFQFQFQIRKILI